MLRFSKRLIAYMLMAVLTMGTLYGCNGDAPEDTEAAADENAPDGENAPDADTPADNAAEAPDNGEAPADENAAPEDPAYPQNQPIAEESPVAITRIDIGRPEQETTSTDMPEGTDEEHEPTPNLFQVDECQVEINGIYKTALSRDLMAAINSRRAEYNIDPVAFNTSLTACADSRCKEQTYFIGHFRPDGSPFSSVSPEGHVLGELIAVEYRTVDDIMEAFFSVNKSRMQMMNPDYTQCGVSIYDIDDTYYIAVLFGY